MDKFNKFFLQLFAEEANGASETEKDAEDNKPESKEEPKKYTDAEVDEILNKKFATWQKAQEKKLSEAERLGKMSEAEKANERIKQLEERIAAADKEKAVAEMTKQARAILSDKNIHVSDALLSNLIADNADDTKAAVESFVSLFNAAVEKAVKEAVKGETPRAGSAPSGLTKDAILAVTNRAERQRLMKENAHLF